MHYYLDGYVAPQRHTIFRIGPLWFYWIWLGERTVHQHRGWILNWHTPGRLIHLTDHRWWRPLRLFPRAMRESFKRS